MPPSRLATLVFPALATLCLASACATVSDNVRGAPVAETHAPSAAGTWVSDRGVVHLREEAGEPTVVRGEYVCRGTVVGVVDGRAIAIDWTSPDGGGKAEWSIEDDGRLVGTWSYGPDDTPGGSWDLAPLRPLAEGDVSGSYESDFGPVHLVQERGRITGSYECPGGVVEGTRDGRTIRFSWQGSDSMGHGGWTLSADARSLEGRWGFGPSADAGGSWNLLRDEDRSSEPDSTEAAPRGDVMHSGLLRAKIVERHDSFRACVNEALESAAPYADRLNVTVTIQPSGVVSSVEVEPGVEGRRFDVCIKEQLGAWRFSAFDGEAWTRTFPYVFNAPPAD
jgi:hypothetical protein